MDIFDEKNLKPMLIAENRPAFDSEDFIYELKLDGIRALVYLSPEGTALRNKRNKVIDNIYPELAGIHKQVKARCILDGELLVLHDGKPDFFEVQHRSLMTNPFKIKLAADKLPACFTAFDIVYYDGRQITGFIAALIRAVCAKDWRHLTKTFAGNRLYYILCTSASIVCGMLYSPDSYPDNTIGVLRCLADRLRNGAENAEATGGDFA